MIKVALAGAGAFGIKHLDGIKPIDGAEVVSLVSRELDKTKDVAAQYGIGHVTTDLAESLALKEVDAVMEEAKRAGATITKAAQKTFWGGYAGYFQDPDGHLWEVAWNPQWSLSE